MKVLILAVLLFGLAPLDATAQTTIVITANTQGEHSPCPVCGNKALGGLARRATLFQSLRSTPGTITVSGGYEFASPRATEPVSTDMVGRLIHAYSALNYDLLLLTPEDRALIDRAEAKVDPAWQTLDESPRVVAKKVKDGQLAFILFPPLRKLTPSVVTTLCDMATDLRASGQYNLIIGVSPWGQAMEAEFIEAQGKTFDIVLGSGEGPSYQGLYLQDGAVLWVRPSAKGKGVNTIDIPTLPKAGEKTVWTPGISISTSLQPLNDSVASDQNITAIFAP